MFGFQGFNLQNACQNSKQGRPGVIKLFTLNSAEQEIYPAHKC